MDRPRGTLCQAAREIQTDGAAARYLIDFRKLLDAFAACSDAQAMCEFLVVDADLVYARILLLDKLDRVILQVCVIRRVKMDLSAPHPGGLLVA